MICMLVTVARVSLLLCMLSGNMVMTRVIYAHILGSAMPFYARIPGSIRQLAHLCVDLPVVGVTSDKSDRYRL